MWNFILNGLKRIWNFLKKVAVAIFNFLKDLANWFKSKYAMVVEKHPNATPIALKIK